MFQVIGDDIHHNGVVIARLIDTPATINGRQALTERLEDNQSDEHDQLLCDYDDLDARMGRVMAERDAYAAILGVTP